MSCVIASVNLGLHITWIAMLGSNAACGEGLCLVVVHGDCYAAYVVYAAIAAFVYCTRLSWFELYLDKFGVT